jgi:bacterioferritin-associated ferredoxin
MTDQPEEIICDCSGTTKAKIHQLINDGKNSFEKIASATGAGTGCGSCDVLIMDILAEKNIDIPTEK